MRSQLITCGYKDGYGQQRLRLERAWGFNGLTLLTPDIISECVFESLYIKRGLYWLSGLFFSLNLKCFKSMMNCSSTIYLYSVSHSVFMHVFVAVTGQHLTSTLN